MEASRRRPAAARFVSGSVPCMGLGRLPATAGSKAAGPILDSLGRRS